MRVQYCLGAIFASLLLSACGITSGNNSSIDVVRRNGLDIHTIDGSHSTLVIRDIKSTEQMCAGRMPDALAQQTGGLGFDTKIGGGVSLGKGSNELALGGRSPDVLIIRELLFRFCELSVNQNLSKAESLKLFNSLLPLVNQALSSRVGGSSSMSSAAAGTPPSTGLAPGAAAALPGQVAGDPGSNNSATPSDPPGKLP